MRYVEDPEPQKRASDRKHSGPFLWASDNIITIRDRKLSQYHNLPATICRHSENGIHVNMGERGVFGAARSRTCKQHKTFDHLNMDAMKMKMRFEEYKV